jgi:hypothetical protein
MWRYLQRVLLVLALAGAANPASAFSLLGPNAGWQVVRIGYNLPFGPIDIGGPMNTGEEYRWNTPTITYGFDQSFLSSFGARGTQAVMQAIAILNNLPPMSQLSSNLSEYPTDTKRINHRASALGLLDMKSHALTYLLEELGLASPERYVYTLRDRRVINNVTWYDVIMRSFDPTYTPTPPFPPNPPPSRYVNDVLYTYHIDEFTAPVDFADAIEDPVDPLAFTRGAVVSAGDGLWIGWLGRGEYFTGLTRDDVGGLRYLYAGSGAWRNPNNENLIPGTTAGQGDCPWCPVGGTNVVSTNTVVDLALRPGVDKITFQLMQHDSLFGAFITVTNQYQDRYYTNSALETQTAQRVLTQPDILFTAEDLGLDAFGNVYMIRRSSTAGWVNNDALNGQATWNGPGVIQPQVVISFSNLGPYFSNWAPGNAFSLLEAGAFRGSLWGSFDGTTNPPVIFPEGYINIEGLEQRVLTGF